MDETAPPDTGDPRVDEVVGSLQTLAERPVEEHPEVFERAHDALRRALAGDGPA